MENTKETRASNHSPHGYTFDITETVAACRGSTHDWDWWGSRELDTRLSSPLPTPWAFSKRQPFAKKELVSNRVSPSVNTTIKFRLFLWVSIVVNGHYNLDNKKIPECTENLQNERKFLHTTHMLRDLVSSIYSEQQLWDKTI